MIRLRQLLLALFVSLITALSMLSVMSAAQAGVMTQEKLKQKFPLPYMVGEKDAELPVWPVFKQNATATELVGYIFESSDFVQVPGFSGVPPSLLIFLDPKGTFVDVQVVSHHEPVFLEGLGEEPLFKFVSQYQGVSLKQNVSVDAAPRNRSSNEGGSVHLDGVAKATASVRIINQTVLSAALKVARKKLGFSGAADPDQIARIRMDLNDTFDTKQLVDDGLIRNYRLKNADVEKAYSGTEGAGLDADAVARPDDTFLDARIILASVPSIGRNLLTDRDWQRLQGRLDEGDHAIMVMWRGRYGMVSDNFVAGTVPDRMVLIQSGLPIEMRDLNMELAFRDPAVGEGYTMKVFRVISQAGLDPAQPLSFGLKVTRLKGMIYPERFSQDFNFEYKLPARYYILPEGADNKTWVGTWKQRWWELTIIVIAMLVLFAALYKSTWLTANEKRFQRFRTSYLLFTVFFIGYYAQGQLSIVNLTGVVQALMQGRSLEYLMWDPASMVIWGGVIITFFVWGRGTFCGWLCPFGALQEFAAKIGKRLGVPQWRIKTRVDAKLKWIKYIALAAIMGAAFYSTTLTDKLVELEPFKTAITLNFVRSWPFVVYAVGLIVLNMVIYKAFCRYLCPFGAGLALFGRLRLWKWLPRRTECGKPCQTCRHRCEYEAIRPDGSIRYDECFQCMDCVVIYHSDDKCAPLMLEKKRARTIPIHAA